MGIVLLLLVVGCAGKQMPEWLSGRSLLYPESAFLIGVGSGEDRGAAENRARLEIAKTFQVDIRARESSSETQTQQGGASDYRQEASSRMDATSGRLLEGVRIAEVWHDAQQYSWHALAVLERARAAAALREGLDGLDRQVLVQLDLAQQAVSPLRSLAPSRRALHLLRQRDALAADLRVVDPLAMVAEGPLPSGELAARVDRLLASLKVALVLDNDRGDMVRSGAVRALAAEGLQLAPDLEATLQLRGRVEVATSGDRDGNAWCTATARIEMYEDRKLFDTLLVTVREGSYEVERAEILARELLGRRLGEKLLEVAGARPAR